MEAEYKIEKYEEYVGNAEEISNKIDRCPICKNKLLHTHYSDHKNLIVQETSKCLECGTLEKKVFHILN